MPEYPSLAPNQVLSELFTTRLPDPEQLVYQYVKDAAAQNLPNGQPALSFYADRARAASEARQISVVRGWPAYPGVVPAIGVASGTEGEDQQHQTIQGGFAGTVTAYEDDGVTVIGQADYYAEPLYVPVVIELVHENRDERDRLHNELRRILFPLRSRLPLLDKQILQVRVDGEKTEQGGGGPPTDEAPYYVYISIFTVHVTCEMLEPRDIVDASGLIARIDGTVAPADTGP